jgi:hypothetical protein
MLSANVSPIAHEIGAHVFGVEGLTPGAVGIMLTMLGLAIIWFIRGAAERKRAANEGVTSLSEANDKLFKNLTAEVARLTKRVADQDKRITAQDRHILEQDKRISELEKELAAARKLVDDVRRSELGAIRAAAQNDISTAEVLKRLDRKPKN